MVITEELKQFIRELVRNEMYELKKEVENVDIKYDAITKDIRTDIEILKEGDQI